MSLDALETLTSEAAAREQSLADWLVEALATLGITSYFGVPGGAAEPLLNALARKQRQGRIEIIATRGEAGAAFAADGYYRETGRMAAVITTTGPGVTNLATAALVAYADRIPMLLLTPQPALARLGRGAFQDCCATPLSLVNMLACCTRFSAAVTHPQQLPHLLMQALHFSQYPPGGPVHLSLPADLLAGRVLPSMNASRFPGVPEGRAQDEAAIERLLKALDSASRPVFYVGDDAGAAAASLCEAAVAMDAPVVSSPAGKRWVPQLHPSYLGVVGFAGHARAMDAVLRSDLVVAFGATFDEFSTNAWTVFEPNKVFAVDRHATFAHRQPGMHSVIADPRSVMERIAQRSSVQRGANDIDGSIAPPTLVRSNYAGPVHPLDLMRWIGTSTGQEVVVHVDTGSSMAWATRGLTRTKPDTYRVAMGACSMCWAIGAAIGAAVGQRRRVISVTGDGAMLMSSLELTVAVERDLPVTCIVLNDSSLGMVRHGQRLSGAEPIATRITTVSFAKLAQACGIEAQQVASRHELDRVPLDWLRSNDGGPRLIDVRIDPDVVPPIGERIAAMRSGVVTP